MGKRFRGKLKQTNGRPAVVTVFGLTSKILSVVVIIAAVCGIWVFSVSASQKTAIKHYNITRYHKKQFDTFTTEEIQWMIDSGDIKQILFAADILAEQKQYQYWSIETFNYLINKFGRKLSTNFHEVTYDRLSSLYVATNQLQNATKILKEALMTRRDDNFASNWYLSIVRLLTEEQQYLEAGYYADECLEFFKDYPTVHPASCIQVKAQTEYFLGRFPLALPWYIKLYEGWLIHMKDESGNHCPATLVSFATPPHEEKSEAIQKRLLLNSDLLKDLDLPVTNCLDQQWPYYFESNGEIKEFSDSPLYSMQCFTTEDKKAVLHKIEDVFVQGSHKHIIHKSGNTCELYVSGLPYPAHLAHPHQNNLDSSYKLPVKYIEKAIILQPYPKNYFHFIVEGLPKLVIAASHPDLRDIDNLVVLIGDNQFGIELVELLDLGFPVELYDPNSFRYHIDQLFVIDWRFEFENGPPGSVLGPQYSEYYIPPVPAIVELNSKISITNPPQPRNIVVFIHRKGGQRIIAKVSELYALLRSRSQSFGLEFFIHGGTKNLNKQEEQLLFSRAVVVMGVHGAGLSNMIFCQEGTVIVELPVLPVKVSEFSRLASALNFPFYTVPGFKMNQTETRYPKVPPETMNDIDNTLTHILQNAGYGTNVK